MGSKFEVWAYVQFHDDPVEDWGYDRRWEGQSFVAALLAAWRLKREGVGCVRLMWR